MTWGIRASTLALTLAACSCSYAGEAAGGEAYDSAGDEGLSSSSQTSAGDGDGPGEGDGDPSGDDGQSEGETGSGGLDLGNGEAPACDPWAQDCPAGEKCSWERVAELDRPRCVPVEPEARAPGEACMVFGDPDSGHDDCELGALCAHVDAETNEGVCMVLCAGSPMQPICADEDASCQVCPDCPSLCVPLCDPLAQDCGPSFVCMPDSGSFACHPSAQNGAGTLGDACEYAFQCQPGHACVDGLTVPGCEAPGCCSPFCELDEPDCPQGMSCAPWFAEDDDDPALPELGVCQAD